MPRILKIGLTAVLLATSAAAYAAPRLPYGPEGKGRFGAYYTTLKYTPEWDAQWRVGSKTDVVVRFDAYDYRLVFWRGTNYMPFWVNDKRAWYSYGCVMRGNATPQYDTLCRYSFASIIESNDARVVIRWRYAPVDKQGNLINTDQMTDWNDWVDEYYTIYPDAAGVRSVRLFTSDKTSPVSYRQSHWITNSASELPDPSANPPTAAVSLQTPMPNWPVSGLSKWQADVPGYFRILDTWANRAPSAEDKQTLSWVMAVGLDQGRGFDASSLIDATPLVASGCQYEGFSQSERAYRLACKGADDIKLTLGPIEGNVAPIHNPAFVIKGWGKSDISLSIDGKPIPRGPDFRYGFRKTDTVSDLIIWVNKQSTKPVTFEIKPVGGGK